MKILQSESPAKGEKVIATFKGDKIVNIEANETVRHKNLDIRINHLFGNMGKESGGGIHNFYGLDQSADIRIGLHYGITDKFMIGVAREKRNENFEGLVKYRLLEQTTDNNIPLAITLFANTTYSIKELGDVNKDVYRFTYLTQVIFARKFSSKFSFALVPSYLHRNFVPADDDNNTFSLSGGLRLKFTRSTSIVSDYTHTFGRKNLVEDTYDVLGIGFEIETGGHVFSLMLSNASGCVANDYLVNTVDSWGKGGIKMGFIISRMLRFNKVDTPVHKKEE
jgi:hypothetical protein